MRLRTKTIDLRKLANEKQQTVATMRRELGQADAANARWRSRFLASGKNAVGKPTNR